MRVGFNMCRCSESESFDFHCLGNVAAYLTSNIALNFTMFPLLHSSLLKIYSVVTLCLGA